MLTIGLRELNQNPSKAVARVRAGEVIVVTDRGKPIMRLVPIAHSASTMEDLIARGEASAPAEHGMPDLIPDLMPEIDSLTDLLVADRKRRP